MRTDVKGISRRGLLTAGMAGGVLLAFRLPLGAQTAERAPDESPDQFAPNAFIRIDGEGRTTLVMPQVEMGQGVYTSIAMILAEELDADFRRVAVEHAPPDERLYANPLLGVQATGNSNSIRAFWTPLRKAGATARAMLVQAAAERWQVDPAGCTTFEGVVTHAASGRTATYAELAGAARDQPAPADAPLKDPRDFTLIGTSAKRLDTPDKVDGRVVYGIDVRLDGMKVATLAQCPVFGGRVAAVDDSAAMQVPGVRQVVVLDDLVAVVGDHMWAAKQGLEALDVTWDEGPHADLSSADIWTDLRAASETDGVVARSTGDIATGLGTGELVEAAYEMPFLAHAAMEPLNCTVRLTPDSCEIWIGTQVASRVQASVAETLGIPDGKVTVINHYIGGGFGRRLEPDMAVAAVRIAQKVAAPLKVIWTREEDTRHDVYRPVYRDKIAATLSGGSIAAWKYRVAGAAVLARWLPPAFQNGIDIDAVDSAVDMPYDIPNVHVEYVRAEPPAVPTGFWRGVGPNNNVFAIECFIDELARKAGTDPVAFRRRMLEKSPRMLGVLDLAAGKAGWGDALPPRVGRGIALQPTFDTSIATVVEAEVDGDGEIQLRRVTAAVDTGIAVNPDTIVAQIEGGLIFGLTAALFGEITIERGRVQQSNFNDYRMLRINETPRIDVHLVRSGEFPGGIGECGVIGGPPALRNAIYAATGVALRRLPIDRSLIAGGTRS
ncbi:xanthine dehydrogenase family protein molybdopterin-binding subunit [Microbaculum marinum]|uniref:Xanthine dehydrogenase family protein molybdopterin-binding subunit n=1 Tax=Microbaculum marinum TaxID=1764581 RepID=A0AAW9RB65_9HYPH